MTRFTTIPALLAAVISGSALACPPGSENEEEVNGAVWPAVVQSLTERYESGSAMPSIARILTDQDGDRAQVMIQREGRATVIGPDGEVREFAFESDGDDEEDIFGELPDELREALQKAMDGQPAQLRDRVLRQYLPKGQDANTFAWTLARPGQLQQTAPQGFWSADDSPAPSPFAGRRAWLGISLAPAEVDGEAATLIQSVFEDSPAEDAGLRAGDIIIAIDEEDEIGVERLVELIGDFEPGDDIELVIVRDGNRFEAEVELGRPAGIFAARESDDDASPFGFTFEAEEREEREERELGRARESVERLLRERVAPRVERFGLQADRLEELLEERLEIIEEEVEEQLEDRFEELEDRFDRLEEMMETLLDRLENGQRRNRRRGGA